MKLKSDPLINPQLNKFIFTSFEEQATKNPDSIAVVFEEHALTYRELNEKSNQLAHFLKHVGAGPEVIVAICVERSLELAIGLLAIMKVGSAFAAFDPTLPVERLSYMLDDTKAPILLTQENGIPLFSHPPANTVCISRDSQQINAYPNSNLSPELFPSSISYIIYTSGSTGKPKGSLITHQSFSNILHYFQEKLAITAGDTLLATAPVTFDMSVFEIFMPLFTGGKLIIESQKKVIDIKSIKKHIIEHNVTLMQGTPAIWKALWSDGWPGKTDMTILCGGEPLPKNLAEFLTSRCKSLWDIYGPSEATLISSTTQIQPNADNKIIISIGTPIANVECFVLDEELNPTLFGSIGELYISGINLARGYLQRADLTAEKFIPNPFSKKSGERMYRTGDLVRYFSDGSLEYLGRMDDQVKIRGFRIELGEIENVLLEMKHIQQAIVLARQDGAEDKYLVAYCVSKKEREENKNHDLDKIKTYLKTKLPYYMIPNIFVFLDKMPLSVNGKIDRAALPKPNLTAKAAYITPRNELETQLTHIWSDVLGIQPIGIEDNFFDLGGHSLLAVKIISRIRMVCGLELPIELLFTHPTIVQISQELDSLKKSDMNRILPLARE